MCAAKGTDSNNSDWEDLGREAINMETANPEVKEGNQDAVDIKAKLSKAEGLKLFADNPKDALESKDVGDEYLMKLGASINAKKLPWLQQIKEEEAEFLVILDRSGSMAGKPWEQVQSAMIKMLEMTAENKKIFTKIMAYSSSAEFVKSSPLEVKRMRAGGSTNFVAVFNLIQELLKKRISHNGTESRASKIKTALRLDSEDFKKRKLFVFFMTDGCDTCNTEEKILQAKEKMQDTISKYGVDVIFHVLGFSSHHDDAFLESLTLLGTSDGSYNYVSPKDGELALEKRLTELLEATTGLIGKSVFLELKMISKGCQFLGDFFGSGPDDIALQAFMQVKGETAVIETQKFVKIPEFDKFQMTIKLLRDLKDDSAEIPCKLTSVEMEDIPKTRSLGIQEKNVLKLRKIRASLNILTSKIGNSVDDKNGKSNYEKELKVLEEWFNVMKKVSNETKASVIEGENEDVDKLAAAVQNGLRICQKAFEQDEDESFEERTKKIRSVNTFWNISSNQIHNQMQVRKKGQNREGQGAIRHAKQAKQMQSDHY